MGKVGRSLGGRGGMFLRFLFLSKDDNGLARGARTLGSGDNNSQGFGQDTRRFRYNF